MDKTCFHNLELEVHEVNKILQWRITDSELLYVLIIWINIHYLF